MSTAAPTARDLERIPRINDPAPEFEAKSTQGPIKLSDYKGKWVVLFSHPADFTPVCTTEFVEFAKRSEEFKKRDAQLVGLSVDSVTAHIAWIRNIEQHFGVKVDFPVIADLDTKVAQKYGLIHPAPPRRRPCAPSSSSTPSRRCARSSTTRCRCGRNIDEVLRVLDGLQTADQTPAPRPPTGRRATRSSCPPPQTLDDAEKRINTPGIRSHRLVLLEAGFERGQVDRPSRWSLKDGRALR